MPVTASITTNPNDQCYERQIKSIAFLMLTLRTCRCFWQCSNRTRSSPSDTSCDTLVRHRTCTTTSACECGAAAAETPPTRAVYTGRAGQQLASICSFVALCCRRRPPPKMLRLILDIRLFIAFFRAFFVDLPLCRPILLSLNMLLSSLSQRSHTFLPSHCDCNICHVSHIII